MHRWPLPRIRSITPVAIALCATVTPAVHADEQGDDPPPPATPEQKPPTDTPAGPQTEAEKQAERLFVEGLDLFKDAEYNEACARLRASLMVFPGTGTRGKLAECYEELGLLASAHRLYVEVERLAREAGEDYRAQVAAERYRALEDRVPRLTIRAGPSVTIPGFRVALDSDVIEPSSLGIGVFVDPGSHEVTAWAPGHAVWRTTVNLGVGNKTIIGVPPLEPAGGTPGRKAQRIAGYALVGVGGAALLAAGYFGVRAVMARDGLVEVCPAYSITNLCPGTDSQTFYDASRSNAQRANWSVGIGLGALAAGTVLWWLGSRSRSRPPSLAAQIVPAVTPNSAVVQISRPF